MSIPQADVLKIILEWGTDIAFPLNVIAFGPADQKGILRIV